MKLLKMYNDKFGKWIKTTFEEEKNGIASHYPDIEEAKNRLIKGEVLITEYKTYKVPKNEIVEERR